MKKTALFLFLLIFIAMLPACGRDKKEAAVTDAAALSQQIFPPRYALVEPVIDAESWTDSNLSACGGKVCYLANQGETCFVRSIDTETGGISDIAAYADMSLHDIAVSPECRIFLLASPVSDEYAFILVELDVSGAEINRYDLDALMPEDGGSPREIEFSQDMLLILSDKYLFNARSGQTLTVGQRIEAPAGARLTCLSDGQPVLAYMLDGNYSVKLLDAEKLRMNSELCFNMPFNSISGGDTWDLYLGDSNAVFGYRIADGTIEKLFSWNGIGIIGGSLVEAGGNLVCSGRIAENSPNPPLILRPIEIAQEKGSVIRFATTDPMGLDFRVQKAIREWNVDNPQCPIEIIDYSVYSSDTDKRASTLKLTADIISGNMPDIYDFSLSSVDTVLSSAQFARRGLLENLYPYLDADQELSREDLIPGVLSAMEINGGLYELVPQYSLVTTFADSRAVGEEKDWNYNTYMDTIENSEYFESVFGDYYDRMLILGNVINASGSRLVDWEQGRCYFDSEYFKNLLLATQAIPETGAGSSEPTLYKVVLNNTGLLYYISLNDLWMASTGSSAFKENYCFPGLPEIGSVIYPSSCYGISSVSASKEECWRFLRQFWTEEYKLEFFLSPRYDGLDAQMDRCWEQLGDTKQYHPYGYEAMEKMADIIKNSRVVYRHDQQIWQIVYSEVGAYFAGDKSIENAIEQIQSKASLYMSEQYG